MHFKKVYGNLTAFFNLIDSVQKTVNQLNTGSVMSYVQSQIPDVRCQLKNTELYADPRVILLLSRHWSNDVRVGVAVFRNDKK